METQKSPAHVLALPAGHGIQCESLRAEDYLQMYREIGGPVGWDTRTKLPVAAVEALLGSVDRRCYVLRANGQAMGLCEFHSAAGQDTELQHFGLLPSAQGKGLGLVFLRLALAFEFASGANRIWLHTDEWDSPAAQKTYAKAGFTVYDRRFVDPSPF